MTRLDALEALHETVALVVDTAGGPGTCDEAEAHGAPCQDDDCETRHAWVEVLPDDWGKLAEALAAVPEDAEG